MIAIDLIETYHAQVEFTLMKELALHPPYDPQSTIALPVRISLSSDGLVAVALIQRLSRMYTGSYTNHAYLYTYTRDAIESDVWYLTGTMKPLEPLSYLETTAFALQYLPHLSHDGRSLILFTILNDTPHTTLPTLRQLLDCQLYRYDFVARWHRVDNDPLVPFESSCLSTVVCSSLLNTL